MSVDEADAAIGKRSCFDHMAHFFDARETQTWQLFKVRKSRLALGQGAKSQFRKNIGMHDDSLAEELPLKFGIA